MADYKWPDAAKRTLIGKRITRLDGPVKVTGKAKYSQDVKRPGMLYGCLLLSPHAHARITSIDVGPAERMPGVKAVRIIRGPGSEMGSELQWEGMEIAAVAATEDQIARDAVRAIKVGYEILPHHVDGENIENAPAAAVKKEEEKVDGDPAKGFQEAEVVHEGYYGIPVITHCCLETHGSVVEWEGDKLNVWPSTQYVSGYAAQLAQPLKVPANMIHVHQDHVGGGFGSKFGPDLWDAEAARLAKIAGKPVRMVLDRSAELLMAGARPSTYARVRVGAKKDGTLTAWESTSWGSGGLTGGGAPPIPYVWLIPNRRNHSSVATNMGPSRAWRAPNHPQACYVTMSALEDLAAALGMDPLEMFLKNIAMTGERSSLYQQELLTASEMIGWKKKWHKRGDPTPGYIKKGLGLSLHTWGGRGHPSDCRLTVNTDGSVAIEIGSQDLGTGTRTIIAIVAAETLGLPLEGVQVNLGDSNYPNSGASGGSTTVGGVSASTRRAATDALNALLKIVAPSLNADPANLEAAGGKIHVKGDPAKSITWKQACAKLGVNPISVLGRAGGRDELSNSGVGGVQMAEVSVDVETGIVKVENFACVQDVGLVIDLKTAESQCHGALIMGICYSLYEEKVIDSLTGRTLNPNMEFYKLAGLGDIGNLMVRMVTGPEQDKRGVIGLGEPPVVSPGAAIGNAVANAIGVRVPSLPLTPDRVLAALEKKGGPS
jgi:xanthine dehydrogenase YagR molybdenum-binding subunit